MMKEIKKRINIMVIKIFVWVRESMCSVIVRILVYYSDIKLIIIKKNTLVFSVQGLIVSVLPCLKAEVLQDS